MGIPPTARFRATSRLLAAIACGAVAACSSDVVGSDAVEDAVADTHPADIPAFVASDASDTGGEASDVVADGSGADSGSGDGDVGPTGSCVPCEPDDACPTGMTCAGLVDGTFCLATCGTGNACGDGTVCGPADGADGDVRVCIPDSLACTPCEDGSARNECGGCGEPAEELGTGCGTCGSGTWGCDDTGGVRCTGDRGGAARNDCGGCEALASAVGGACGTCGDGTVVCVGADETSCSGATGDSDGDTVCDSRDRCPGEDDRLDADGDHQPDACDPCPNDARDDSDGDGSCDSDDLCPAGDDRLDDDEDGVPDRCDLCAGADDTLDGDDDGTPDACDCDAATCPEGAGCTESTTGVSCPCLRGWEPDGEGCAEIDECARETDACDPAAVCENTAGSYTCTCPGGWEGDGETCADVDECARRIDECHPDAACTNTDGSYECECPLGYSGDGRSCVRISIHTFDFPLEGDTFESTSGTTLITAADDGYSGTRTLPIRTISSVAAVAPAVAENNLYSNPTPPPACYGFATMQLVINGVLFGGVNIAEDGDHAFSPNASATRVSGPEFDIELRTVAVLCGSFSLSATGTTITVIP